jgi:hypothetical protein
MKPSANLRAMFVRQVTFWQVQTKYRIHAVYLGGQRIAQRIVRRVDRVVTELALVEHATAQIESTLSLTTSARGAILSLSKYRKPYTSTTQALQYGISWGLCKKTYLIKATTWMETNQFLKYHAVGIFRTFIDWDRENATGRNPMARHSARHTTSPLQPLYARAITLVWSTHLAPVRPFDSIFPAFYPRFRLRELCSDELLLNPCSHLFDI